MKRTPIGEDGAATSAVAAVDPQLAAFIERAGPFGARPGEGDSFTSLARAIVYQQLAGRAAAAIYGRFVAVVGGVVTADAILATESERLRGAGLSGNKTTSLIDLATKVRDGTVPLDGIEAYDDDEIVARLTAVRGIGRWTAEMFLIFHLLRPNVLPLDDPGLIRGISENYFSGEPVSRAEARELGDGWAPYRSVATWYLWRSLDPVSSLTSEG
jgi:DNA-3-methyladenine glycosylase II